MNQQYTAQQCRQARLSRDPRFDGLFFIAVKSTGIFCRTVCPAPLPMEKNVEYYSLAQQAMHAGFRPCLRCRPDSAPQSCAWQGVTTTVNRAQNLLSQHFDLTITEIAAKLGVGERYLRQLFARQLGISPKQYQLFEQLLFAKKLLHETNFRIDEVAQASGFASARRLQTNMQQLMSLSPSALRKKSTTVSKELKISLAYRPPYHWAHLRDFLALRAIEGLEHITDDSYARNFTIDGAHGHFCAKHEPLQNRFAVTLILANASMLKPALQNIRRVLDIDADTAVISKQLIAAGLAPSNVVLGLRLPGVWSPFEAGCRAILGQQISVSSAIKLVGLLVSRLGDSFNNGLVFPSPEQVAKSDLAFLKMPGKRRESLRIFAQYCADNGDFTPEDWLCIKGIGPWTVAYAKMRGNSNPDIWLDSDLVIKKQLQVCPVNADLVAPWRSYLTLQLWSMA